MRPRAGPRHTRESLAFAGLPRGPGGTRLGGCWWRESEVAGAKSFFNVELCAWARSSGCLFMRVSFAGLALRRFPGTSSSSPTARQWSQAARPRPSPRPLSSAGWRWGESAIALWFLEEKYSCASAEGNGTGALVSILVFLASDCGGRRSQTTNRPQASERPLRAFANNRTQLGAHCCTCRERRPQGSLGFLR